MRYCKGCVRYRVLGSLVHRLCDLNSACDVGSSLCNIGMYSLVPTVMHGKVDMKAGKILVKSRSLESNKTKIKK